MRYFCLIFIALLTMMSCGDMFYKPECYDFDIECVNTSDDTLHVAIYGHEIGDSGNTIMRLEYSPWPVLPRSSKCIMLWLNNELEPTWENIWYSYGIDTLYVVVSHVQKEEKSFEKIELSKENDILKTYKFTKNDKALDENNITIVYP